MAIFLLKRFVHYLILTVVVTSGSYFLASATLDPKANFANHQPPIPKATINRTLDLYNVNPDVSVLTRFYHWWGFIVHGSLGPTITGGSVAHQMFSRMGVSLQLLIAGSILGAIFGVVFGVISAIRQYKFADNAISGFAYLMLAMPVFVLAVLLEIGAVEINDKTGHRIFVYTGAFTPGLSGGFWAHVGDRISHLILPTVALILFGIASYSRYQRNAMLDVLGSEFIRTARAKGLTRRRALIKHGLRTALIPLVVFFAYSFGTILVGATLIEIIFGWHGMGEFFITAIQTNDVNSSVAMVGFTSILILLAGLLSDLAYAALDPRVRT